MIILGIVQAVEVNSPYFKQVI